MKNYDIFDLVKYILSIMVIAIHSSLFPMVLYPWLRLAIPLFFIISSFLLFKKINTSPKEERKSIIKKYIIRLIKLYLFWFIILIPFTIHRNINIFNNGVITGIMRIISSAFFSSTFPGSWYIIATIEGTLIVSYLSKKYNWKLLLVLFLIINILCSITQCYHTLFTNLSFLKKAYSFYTIIFSQPQFNFSVALIYILLGKLFADGKFDHFKKVTFIVTMIASIILLYLEWRFIYKLNGYYNRDCYIFLVPLSFSMFGLIRNIDTRVKNYKTLRQISNFSYPFHISFIAVIHAILNKIKFISSNEIYYSISTFLITTICVIFAYSIVHCLEKNKYLNFLKYSH